MERDKIEALLDRYWKAETTLEEERIIKNYLRENRPIGEFNEEASLFRTVSDLKSFKAKEVHFLSSPNSIVTQKFGTPAILKIAATVVLITCASLWGVNYNRSLQAQYQLVMQHKIEADLLSMSNSLNHANSGLTEIISLKAGAKSPNQ